MEYSSSQSINNDFSNGIRDKIISYIIDEDIKKKLLELLERLTLCLDILNIDYWLDGGSLLGLYRHGGVIPWDEDIDIGIQLSDSYKIEEHLEFFKSCGISIKKNRTNAYFQADNNIECPGELDKTIHIDIFLYELNIEDNSLYNTDCRFRDNDIESGHCNMIYNKNKLFPTQYYKFENIEVKAPLNIKEILNLNLGDDYMKVARIKKNNVFICSIDLEDEMFKDLFRVVSHE